MDTYKTVKIPLKTIFKRQELLGTLNAHITELNDLVIHTYQFIRLYLLHCFENQIPFPDIDESWVRYCLTILGEKTGFGMHARNTSVLSLLTSFYEKEYQPLFNHQKHDIRNKSQLITHIATQIYTSIVVNVQEHFVKHFKRFVRKTTKDLITDKTVLYSLTKQLLDLEWEEIDPLFSSWKETYLHHILPTEDINTSIPYDVKVRPLFYLKFMMQMCYFLEERGSKLFQCIPQRTEIIPKYVLFDTTGIFDLLCPTHDNRGLPIRKTEWIKHIVEHQDAIWRLFLNLDHPVFKQKGYTFNYQIRTDSFGCSLMFIKKGTIKMKNGRMKKPKKEDIEAAKANSPYKKLEALSEEDIQRLSTKKVVGLDPGKFVLTYMMDEAGNKLRYTAAQRRHETKSNRQRDIMAHEKKLDGVQLIEATLSEKNSKTMNYDLFKQYIVAKEIVNRETSVFYQQIIWRKFKFRTVSLSQQSLDRFINKIKTVFGEDIVIAYGDWSQPVQLKNQPPTMNKGIRKIIAKNMDVVSVHEYNTSKKCCDCHSDLEYYQREIVPEPIIESTALEITDTLLTLKEGEEKAKKKKKEKKEVWRLQICRECVSSENKIIIFKNRDANSALNILYLAKFWFNDRERPKAFTHNPKKLVAVK